MTKYLVLALTVLLCAISQAQVTEKRDPAIDNGAAMTQQQKLSMFEGQSFIIGFMENEISNFVYLELSIHISSKTDNIVAVRFPDGVDSIRLVAAGTTWSIIVSDTFEVTVAQIPQRKSITVESDEPVSIIVFSSQVTTSDTYAAIPIGSLGTEYYTMNMSIDNYADNAVSYRGGEFMIIATEDNTQITVTPSDKTSRGNRASVPFNVTLQDGECYLIQDTSDYWGMRDLTGSHIVSTKPIVVLSGHKRTGIPFGLSTSKDHLVEMLPQMAIWDTAHITTPFLSVTDTVTFRLIVSDSAQVAYIIAGDTVMIDFTYRGEWREVRLKNVVVEWISNTPFMLTQFMPSPSYSTLGKYYDPAMIVIPPTSQFIRHTVIHYPELLGQVTPVCVLNLVVDSNALQTITLDGQLLKNITPYPFIAIQGTPYLWCSLRVTTTTHSIQCDSTGLFSGTMYSLSAADSYANSIGYVLYESLPVVVTDTTPPSHDDMTHCDTLYLDMFDTYLDSITVVSSDNITAIITQSDTIAHIYAHATDRTLNATYVVTATDSSGNTTTYTFTYVAPTVPMSYTDTLMVLGSTTCTSMAIYNALPIDSITISNTTHYILTVDSVTIDSTYLTVCYDVDTAQLQATITVHYDCNWLTEIEIVPLATYQLVGDTLHFGAVYVGDTICLKLGIVNLGTAPILVPDTLIIDNVFYTTPVSRTLLQPKDTLWVLVCFNPTDTGFFTKEYQLRGASILYTGQAMYVDTLQLDSYVTHNVHVAPCEDKQHIIHLRNVGNATVYVGRIIVKDNLNTPVDTIVVDSNIAQSTTMQVPFSISDTVIGDSIYIYVECDYDTLKLSFVNVKPSPYVITVGNDTTIYATPGLITVTTTIHIVDTLSTFVSGTILVDRLNHALVGPHTVTINGRGGNTTTTVDVVSGEWKINNTILPPATIVIGWNIQTFWTTSTPSTITVTVDTTRCYTVDKTQTVRYVPVVCAPQLRSIKFGAIGELTAVVYPNPTDDESVLELTTTVPTAVQYDIIDLHGKGVINNTAHVTKVLTIPLSLQISGMYWIRVFTSDSKVLQLPILVY